MRTVVVAAVVLAFGSVSSWAAEGSDVSPELEKMLQREFRVSAETVDQVVASGLGHEDTVVTFFVAKRAGMSPPRVAALRQQGDSWRGIADMRGLGPWDFYVMVNGRLPGARYSAIMSKFGLLPTSDWSKVPLTDEDIVDLVNAKFVASGHDYSIFETIALREEGTDFSEILLTIGDRKHALLAKQRSQRTRDYAGSTSN